MQKKAWLEKFTWDVVTELNRQACEVGKMAHKPSEGNGFQDTRALWDQSLVGPMTFRETVELCRKCHRLAPFAFFNGNTFAGIARTLCKEASDGISPTKAFLVRSAVGHYVAGVIDAKEFDEIFERALAGGTAS